MLRLSGFLSLLAIIFSFSTANSISSQQAQAAARVVVLDSSGNQTARVTDGDTLVLRLEDLVPAPVNRLVRFILEPGGYLAADCTLLARQTACQSAPLAALGWYWEPGGKPQKDRAVTAEVEGLQGYKDSPPDPARVAVSPRPVVMVHGFSSSWEAWSTYLGAEGYLAAAGIQGFAVGDGQVDGALNTGSIVQPASRTNTLAQNAAILSGYIDEVKVLTGAQQVDLLAHSMGGLISRYYIGREMDGREAAQLIMLGSPMAGTACANLPAALGLYLPATLELRPEYISSVFNSQIAERGGVPFFALAGVPIQEGFKSPCTEVPSDLVVSLESVRAIDLEVAEMPLLHTHLNTSEQVFAEYVLPLLSQTPDRFQRPIPFEFRSGSQPVQGGQFSRVYTGRVQDTPEELVIHIEEGVQVASFALYDSSRSLQVQVVGASGNEIVLSPDTHGLVVLEDPAALFYLGYGFDNPRPGQWRVTLLPGPDTPAGGANYALSAQFTGGARLKAQASSLIARPGERVELAASLEYNGQAVPLDEGWLDVRAVGQAPQRLPLAVNGSSAAADWTASEPGLYGLDLQVTGRSAAGDVLERTAFLAVEVRPQELDEQGRARLYLLVALGAALLILTLFGVWLGKRRSRRR